MPRRDIDEEVDELVERITQAWFKLTEFGDDVPVEQHALDVRRAGRDAMTAAVTELVDRSPGRFAHDASQIVTRVLVRLADEQPRALVLIASEAVNELADRRRAQR